MKLKYALIQKQEFFLSLILTFVTLPNLYIKYFKYNTSKAIFPFFSKYCKVLGV